jgi:hypothetical protein
MAYTDAANCERRSTSSSEVNKNEKIIHINNLATIRRHGKTQGETNFVLM